MMNIVNYLEWRGDLSFEAAPFNEVDNFILTQAINIDYSGIVPQDSRPMTLAQAAEKYQALYGDDGKYMGVLLPVACWPLVKQMVASRRFGQTVISGFTDRVIPENTEQFTAVVFTLAPDLHYISIRGTDDTIAAWKENFMMAVRDTVPARDDALAYLNWAADNYSGRLIVGGHSKGGNLAVWAATQAAPAIQDRIVAVYSNDGPGFKPDFYESDAFRRISDRVHVILPQYSVVGTFFDQPAARIIKSNKSGLLAHDGFNWEVLGDRFVEEPELARSSQSFDTAFDDALNRMDEKTRCAFIDDLFDALSASGTFRTLTDVKSVKPRQLNGMLKTLRSNPDMKKLVQDIFSDMFREFLENLGDDLEAFGQKLSQGKKQA